MRIEPFAMERFFARYEHRVRHMLCASSPEPWKLEQLFAMEPALQERIASLSLNYTESRGGEALRAAIGSLYRGLSPEQVLVTSGSAEAIYLFLNAVLSPRDHVIVHSPCYPSLYQPAMAMGCRVDWWQAQASQGWALDPDDLKRLVRPDTRAVIVNVPHNPTGWVMPEGHWIEMIEFLDQRGILLLSDEVYRFLEHDPADRLPAACELSDKAVSLGSMSKAFALPGLRIGWAATRNRELLQRMWELKDYTTICHGALNEVLAEAALRHRDAILAENLALARANWPHLERYFQQDNPWSWVRPMAGVTVFPELQRALDSEPFCMSMLEAHGLLLLPGKYYQPDVTQPNPWVRIGFGKQSFPSDLALLSSVSERFGVIR